jgi:hypothetical protein
VVDTSKDQPWYYMGAFILDDTVIGTPTEVRLNVPKKAGDGQAKGIEAVLADSIVKTLQGHNGGFESIAQLKAMLAEESTKYSATNLSIALELLVLQDRLVWPEVSPTNKPRPGWLTEPSRRSNGSSE